MTLQLDTVPSLGAVEQYARSLTAELEVIAVSRGDGAAAKRNKVAAIIPSPPNPQKGSGKPSPTVTAADGGGKKAGGRSKVPCSGWITDSGCRFGKNCQFSHEADRAQKCWICGGSHQKAECTAPGGGKGPNPEPRTKAKAQALTTQGGRAKSDPKSAPKAASSKGEGSKPGDPTTAAIKEATQLLQSMRISKLEHVQAVTQLKDLGEGRRRKGLIDGGATACLRTAKASERSLPTLNVELACGSCTLHINQAGTLLSPNPVTPIVSVAALLELGFRIDWSKENCVVNHNTKGQLLVDATSGCPEIEFETALQLIAEYEEHVKSRDVHEARVRCLLMDMGDASHEQLAETMWNGGVEAAAAVRLLASRMFPAAPSELLKQVPVSLCQAGTVGGWNRRTRRRAQKSGGVVVHFSDKGSKRSLEEVIDRCGWMLLHVDVSSTAMSEAAYAFLMSLAHQGLIRGVIGSPPFRSFSGFKYLASLEAGSNSDNGGTVRLRGRSVGSVEGLILSGPEAAARRSDDMLILRVLLLFAVASRISQRAELPTPAFVLEQPEDQPSRNVPSFWATPEWISFAEEFEIESVSFDQGPLMHQQRRPTTLASNLMPDPRLVGCRGPGLESVPAAGVFQKKLCAGAAWAPGLTSAVADMLWRRSRDDLKRGLRPKARALDQGFIEHIKQGHVPYRNDCQYCVRGSAKRRQHRRVLCPEAWSLSIDSAGPYKKGEDENVVDARYLVVGVLTIPILALADGKEGNNEGDPVEDLGGALDDEEIFADGEDEPDEPLNPKELAEAKSSQGTWDELINRDQQAWREEAEREHLPQIKLVEWPFVEPIAKKTQQNVLAAVRKMRAEALNLGFEVRRIHTDRGREYQNAGLRAFCNQHSIVKTLAFAEEHQSNGRVESLIGRVKAKTRVFLEQGEAPTTEWPMAARLAGVVLQNRAREALHMKPRAIVPYNTQVQVVQRSWRRGAWHSITVSAKTKGPSADNDRGWVVVTSDGNVLSTNKVFPSPEDHKKLVVKYEGDPVDPSAPDRRIRSKTALRTMVATSDFPDPSHKIDMVAADALKAKDFSPKAVARLALELSKVPCKVLGSTPAPVTVGEKGAFLFAGAFSYGGITGLQNSAIDHPWVTAYLAQYLQQFTSEPFAAVGLIWNAEHEPHRDCHNQKGIKNIVVPVVTSGGGVWVQSEGLSNEQLEAEEVKQEVKPGVQIGGRILTYHAGSPITFNAAKWHASVKGSGQQLLVVGYTPRSLHKLKPPERKRLWDLGFPFVPATHDEFWTVDSKRSTITRHHPIPRKPLFVPKAGDAPFPLEFLGNVRYCEQVFADGNTSRHMQQWRQTKASLAIRAKWTGKSVFQFAGPDQDCEDLGGAVRPLNFFRCKLS